MPHWEALKQGVQNRGMWHLVARSGEEATAHMLQELRGEEAPFDPLMAANWAICGAAIEFGGLAMLSGNICPLCEADVHGGHANNWINGCLDEQLRYAFEKGLMPVHGKES